MSKLQDPSTGLGLTLVDGQLNGITGVYVKSVADGGAGQKAVSIRGGEGGVEALLKHIWRIRSRVSRSPFLYDFCIEWRASWRNGSGCLMRA